MPVKATRAAVVDELRAAIDVSVRLLVGSFVERPNSSQSPVGAVSSSDYGSEASGPAAGARRIGLAALVEWLDRVRSIDSSMACSITTRGIPVTAEKVRENRLRRMAERQGLELRKSRRRDPRAKNYGRWYIVDVDREIEAADDVATESFTARRRALEIARAEFVVKECDDLDVVEAFLTDVGRQS
jgi:hypothetical protein